MGYLWLDQVSVPFKEKYVVRYDALLSAIGNLENESIGYVVPDCGMFVSRTINFKNYSKYQKSLDSKDDFTKLQNRLYALCERKGVQVVSGSDMAAEKDIAKSGNPWRLTFAYQDVDDDEEGIKRLGKALLILWDE
ncbi:hypothetical protein NADFUDRAFT_51332 [Nadsonia fulvescens var. elongata DSM 6958]|uniref:PLP-dependent transferase n=1 Tax=Nadsonia fulvescens var. elongata DSM 6958 TaxID=857566 RepID=A0A1E3PLA0_9ASCO|nr:hypothetical protein NADFUDRAFT_51332 [Nadsonia fulvescens var. elongata DSM 6958]